MKVLFTASVIGHIQAFHLPYLRYFRERGCEVHTAARGEGLPFTDRHYDIGFQRSPLKLGNITAYRALKKIIYENGYDIIHCHTPVVGVLTRLAARKVRKKGTMVVYTAHGFHFYKGGPFIMGLLFRLVEKILSRYTDYLVTINNEDYGAVKKYGFKPGAFYKIHGVGVDEKRFQVQTPQNKAESRKAYGINEDAFVLIFAAELSQRKNQQMLLEAVHLLKRRIPGLLLILAGEGPLRTKYEKQIHAYGIDEFVRLPGYRKDMDKLLLTADMSVSSARQEGLPVNIAEAMAVSLPVVATRIRGHSDLISEGKNGFLVEVDDAQSMAQKLFYLYENRKVMENMQKETLVLVKPFLLENAGREMTKIYEDIIRKKWECSQIRK